MGFDGCKLTRVRWEIESKCNLQCRHCFVGNKVEDVETIEYDDAIKIVDRLSGYGVKSISFTTKEPLLFHNLDKIILYCTSKGIQTDLVTNGILFEDYELANKVVSSGVNTINISLEGISTETNDYIRGEGTLDKVMKALDNLKRVRDKKRNVYIVIQMTLNRKNLKEVEEIPQFFNELPIDSLFVGDISLDGNAERNSDLVLSQDEFMKAWDSIFQAYSKLENKKYYLCCKSLLPIEYICFNIKHKTEFQPLPPKCSVMNDVFSVLANGELMPCIALMNKSQIKYPKVKVLGDKIDFDKFGDFKIQLKNYVEMNKVKACSDCYYNSICMPCPASMYQQSFRDKLQQRCTASFQEIKRYLNGIEQNYDLYKITVRNNVMMTIIGKEILLKKYYQNGMVHQKQYNVNSNELDMMSLIFDKGTISFNELLRGRFETPKEVIKFLEPYIYDDYITFMEG